MVAAHHKLTILLGRQTRVISTIHRCTHVCVCGERGEQRERERELGQFYVPIVLGQYYVVTFLYV